MGLEELMIKGEPFKKTKIHQLLKNVKLFANGRISFKENYKLSNLFYKKYDDKYISRGPIYVSFQRFPYLNQDINKDWKREILSLLNNIYEEKSDLVRFILLDHLIESTSYLTLVIYRLIIEDNKKEFANIFVKAFTLSSLSAELFYHYSSSNTLDDRILLKLKNLVHSIFSSPIDLSQYYKKRKIKKFNKIVYFWRPREAQNEIRNFIYAYLMKEKIKHIDVQIDVVSSIFYGSLSIMGHILGAMREINESAIPMLIVYSKNEKLLRKSRKLGSSTRIKSFLTELWGALTYRPILLIDDSIGTGRTLKNSLILTLYLARGYNLSSLIERFPSRKQLKELIKFSKENEIYVAIESSSDINSIKDIISEFFFPPAFPAMSGKLMVIYPKYLYKAAGLKAELIPEKAEYNVILRDPEKFKDMYAKYKEFISTA